MTGGRFFLRIIQGVDHRIVENIKHGLAHVFADFYKQGRHKRCFHLIARQADKVLEVRVFLDLGGGLRIGQPKLALNDHRTDDQPGILGWATLSGRKAFKVGLCQVIQRDVFAHPDPAVVFIQRGLEVPAKLREGELPVAF